MDAMVGDELAWDNMGVWAGLFITGIHRECMCRW